MAITVTVGAAIDEGDGAMWAQMISVQLKDGSEAAFGRLIDELKSAEQPDSGLVRSLALQDQDDPSRVHMLVLFESEEKARARESDPRRAEGLDKARATMGEVFAGAPEFANLDVIADWAP